MPTISDIAVCIRRWDFSETSQTVSLFTRDHGLVRGLAKGAKRATGRYSGGIDLLTLGHVVAIVRPAQELALITEWTTEDSFPHLRRRLDANRAALFIIDLVHHMLTDIDPHPGLFDALVAALAGLAMAGAIDGVLVRFQWALLVETGYRPELDRDAATGAPAPHTATLAFSPRAGGLVADTGAGDRWRVRRQTIDILRQVSRGGAPDSPDPAAISRAAHLLATYLRELIGRDLPTMHAVFPEP
jgi:DNA repair protein RecO (recombination protein O)